MDITPNWFAYLALLAWPVVGIYLFRTRPLGEALVWTILGGFLLLPVGAFIKMAGVPGLDKNSAPNLAALAGCILVSGRLPRIWYRFGLAEFLFIGLLIVPFVTSELNGDLVHIGPLFLPSIGHYEALSAAVDKLIYIIPFILGRQFLRDSTGTTTIIRALAVSGVVYSLPMLLEMRLSPQLHAWVYGYFPHEFSQQIRDGGYRPVVFLGHGLMVAFFTMTALVAASALWRARVSILTFRPGGIVAYLAFLLVLCRSLGSLIYGLVLTPLVAFFSPRAQLRVAIVLAAFALCYPVLRAADLVPTQFLLQTADSVSEDRELSLRTRFDNEAKLLARAAERFWFGWGRFGRNRVYADDGHDISVTDGYWIIVLGTFGFIGFLAEFGLLSFPVFRAAQALRYAASQDRIFLAALALIVSINMLDLIPNASIRPWTWLMVGALLGRAEALLATRQSSHLTSTGGRRAIEQREPHQVYTSS